MGGDVFKYHNGIVDHHTYWYRQRWERYDIQSVARHKQIYERGNKWYRDGDCNDYSCPPPAQEQEHNDNYKQECIEHSFGEWIDGVSYIVRCVDNDTQFNVGWEIFLNRRKFFHHFFRDRNWVGAWLFLYYNHGTLLAIVVSFLCTFFKRVVYSCHVAKIYQTVIVNTYN